MLSQAIVLPETPPFVVEIESKIEAVICWWTSRYNYCNHYALWDEPDLSSPETSARDIYAFRPIVNSQQLLENMEARWNLTSFTTPIPQPPGVGRRDLLGLEAAALGRGAIDQLLPDGASAIPGHARTGGRLGGFGLFLHVQAPVGLWTDCQVRSRSCIFIFTFMKGIAPRSLLDLLLDMHE